MPFTKNKNADQSADSTTSSTTSSTENKGSKELAEPTTGPGEQTVDPSEDKVLIKSEPDEIAPIPDAATGEAPKPAPSSTGYRVADGSSITAKTGELIDSGHEISPDHVDGGEKRLEELVKLQKVIKTDKSGGGSSSDASSSVSSSSSSSGGSSGGSSGSSFGGSHTP